MYISHTNGRNPQLYDLNEDPDEKWNIAARNENIVKRMHNRIVQDAGGSIPNYDIPWRVW